MIRLKFIQGRFASGRWQRCWVRWLCRGFPRDGPPGPGPCDKTRGGKLSCFLWAFRALVSPSCAPIDGFGALLHNSELCRPEFAAGIPRPSGVIKSMVIYTFIKNARSGRRCAALFVNWIMHSTYEHINFKKNLRYYGLIKLNPPFVSPALFSHIFYIKLALSSLGLSSKKLVIFNSTRLRITLYIPGGDC